MKGVDGKYMDRAKRYGVLDWLRGFAIINMIIYHVLWDVVYIFGVEIGWYKSIAGFIWQQFICWLFILLSGFCHRLGGHKLKRGLWLIIWSVVISVVTIIFMKENAILFGVLTCIGMCMLIMIPLGKVVKNINPYIGFVIFFILFMVTRNVNSGSLGFGNRTLLMLPEQMYQNHITAFFGFPPQGFVSSDYFSIFPWIFLYITGYCIYGIFERKNLMRFLEKPRIKFLEYIGRHSLAIYVIHQPVIYLIISLLF